MWIDFLLFADPKRRQFLLTKHNATRIFFSEKIQGAMRFVMGKKKQYLFSFEVCKRQNHSIL